MHTQPRSPITILAIADSDSYLKWAATTLDTLGPDCAPRVVLVRSPIFPSPAQCEAATSGTRFATALPRVVSMPRLRRMLREHTPDVILLAGTGPVMEVVAEIAVRLPSPPALISGIPGMALPARAKGIEFRSRVHSMVVHSERERTEYAALMDALGVRQDLVLNPLPFLPPRAQHSAEATTTLVFTPQALVPRSAHQRERILRALHSAALTHTDLTVVVKVRALAGEQQTHNEQFPYDSLWDDLCERDKGLRREALTFAAGPLSNYLSPGSAHVTVSSTAALESLAVGLPTMILSDFGVNERLLNAVYSGSGCVGTLEDVVELRFGQPDRDWLTANYFHTSPPELPAHLVELAGRARSGTLPTHPPLNVGRRRRRLARNWLRSTVPPALARASQRVSRALRRAL